MIARAVKFGCEEWWEKRVPNALLKTGMRPYALYVSVVAIDVYVVIHSHRVSAVDVKNKVFRS